MSPLIWLALLKEIALPELQRWLSELQAEGRTVTEEEALAKLERDVEDANAIGRSFLTTTAPPPQP